ncbi:mannose-1-phosphate guanylyltransferase/mannose-1-phosphate guanylyltransferase / mannose-6-phosphate isomerase [Paracoccus isoporae]|uniref:mannose-1-phosphate guanylyltransferase n=1 Tax=Paracoccus isoporae TaxID=591205 RepID=A0A1G6X0H1_9RHOB|nr:mannose-1-phosphate guanylyltransferase/mannose-6-phosphate isomerase [Paracoccus isoporae]SDD71569.1 mannose-1-phosphate guanylyltransferase/mannose-1-phosphate guanylyltransferase / mannose-6-phosphate isomerase [Paracoccus isoporae]
MPRDTPKLFPVILSGGSGTRLWPLSRKSYPKQFAPLIGDRTLFQEAALRFAGEEAGMAAPIIVTNADFRFVVTEQLAAVGIDPGAVLIEPEPRNTAPAVLVAAFYLMARDPDAVMLVAPSDHAIPDRAAFLDAVTRGMEAVSRGRIVTFGITPDRPETGYGYLELETAPSPDGAASDLLRFVEKPGAAAARDMLASGKFLWNAGIFLARAADMVEAFRKHAPDVMAPVSAALKNATADLGFLRLAPGDYAKAPSISVDYAVMEKAGNLAVVPFSAGWSDLGGWDAVWREQGPDGDGVATSGPAEAIDCRDSLLRAETDGQVLVGIGLDNIIAVAMPDAVLVAPKDRAQDVKLAVARLKAHEKPQAETLPRDYRPWGWYETLVLGPRFQVKRIVVNPGAALSLQSHHHRAEHWIVVEGTAKVTVNSDVSLVSENQSVYVPLGAVHRLENPGKLPMVLIEVQTGSYLGEDDIVRHDDIYARGQGARG